ncbi:MAG: type VI secretion system Vgr family protein [Roseiarcus sp.]
MPNPTQDGRIGSLATPLGKDALLLGRFDAFEGLGELFEYRIEALSVQEDIDFNGLIGRNHSVHLETVDQVGRDFSGVLVEARWVGKRGALYVYRLVLRPWLWLLSRTSDCRIFSKLNMSNPSPLEIVKKVFSDRGFTDFSDRTSESYPTLEYCVQYRESDMNFVCRMMEEYGIYYYFQHEKGDGGSPTKHTLVLADSKSSHDATPGLASAFFSPLTGQVRRDRQQFDDWTTHRGFQSGKFTLNDYDYEKPDANLVADAEQPGGYERDSMEIYDYPGRYDDQGEGATLAKVRLEADQAKDRRRSAVGYAPSLTPGYKITRTSVVGPQSEDIEYLLLRCTHSYGYQTYESAGVSADDDAIYTGAYELASSERPFRSPLLTRKSIIQGPQTAKVVGQGEIDVDKEGRILVEFYWDRKKTSSRRVRVGQIWAGQYQKTLFIPRVGDEVVVQYLEGDPDRPMVVGSVYNANNTPPVTLPDNKTKSGINTQSSTGHSGHNTFSFEDSAGEEYVHLKAQKDLTVNVLNNETRTVGNDQQETITGNLTQQVNQNLNQTVNQNQTLNVGQTYSLTAMQEIVLTVGPSSITIDPTGITLSAPMITLNAMATISESAPAITVTADAAYALTAATVAITGVTTMQPVLTVNGAIAWTAAAGPPPIPVPA